MTNNNPIYISKMLNHPPNILKQLPEFRSVKKYSINQSIKIYSKALKDSGFKDKLKYLPNQVHQVGNNKERKRKTKSNWFNPPYSKNVKINMSKVFLKLLKKSFPASNILCKIFNKNTVKISHSCMRNINSGISSHYKSILNPRTLSFWCNCWKKKVFP